MFGRPHRDAEFGFPPEYEARESVAEIHQDLVAHLRSFIARTPSYVDRKALVYAFDDVCQRFETDLFEVLKAWTK